MFSVTIQERYIDLLKKTVLNLIYFEANYAVDYVDGWLKDRKIHPWERDQFWSKEFKDGAKRYREGYAEGKFVPTWGHTMLGLPRLENVESCLRSVIEDNVPGDFVECGVWRGGTCIFARGLFDALGVENRDVWVCDSFEGLPPPDVDKYPADEGINLNEIKMLAVPLEQVKQHFEDYGLLDDRVHFVKGFFRDTLHKAKVETISVLRLDGDLYESTMDTLTALYDKVSPGGYIIVDDYNAYEACKEAVHDFRDDRDIEDEIVIIDSVGVYWRKKEA